MALRLGVRLVPPTRPGHGTRQFVSFFKPHSTPRINTTGPSMRITSPVFRRAIFGIGKKQPVNVEQTATRAAKSVAEVVYRFASYSTVFVIIVVTGFFVYDVTHRMLVRLMGVVADVSSTGGAEGVENSYVGN
jgi:hypothetical protein